MGEFEPTASGTRGARFRSSQSPQSGVRAILRLLPLGQGVTPLRPPRRRFNQVCLLPRLSPHKP